MESLLKSRKFEVVRRPVEAANGECHAHDFVVHPGAVVVLPLLDDGHCLLIRNYRASIDRELWELPAGTMDMPDEDPTAAAGRELEEETGYRAATLTPLCGFYPSPGFLTEYIRAFVATGLCKTEQRLDPTERIRVVPMPFDEAIAMACDGRIEDAKTIITLLRWDLQRRQAP